MGSTKSGVSVLGSPKLCLCICAVLLALWALPAYSALTQVYQTSHLGEKDLESGLDINPLDPGNTIDGTPEILDSIYGSWVRIDDTVDQIWMDLNGGIDVKAIYASFDQQLGYSLDETDGDPIIWLDDIGGDDSDRIDAVGEIGSLDIVPDSDLFVWIRGNNDTDNINYSRDSLNGGKDRMVTYRILTDLSNDDLTNTYVIAWEDLTDDDFNDLVVEVTGVKPIPEPATIALLGLGMAGLLRLRRKQR